MFTHFIFWDSFGFATDEEEENEQQPCVPHHSFQIHPAVKLIREGSGMEHMRRIWLSLHSHMESCCLLMERFMRHLSTGSTLPFQLRALS